MNDNEDTLERERERERRGEREREKEKEIEREREKERKTGNCRTLLPEKSPHLRLGSTQVSAETHPLQ